MGFGGAVLESLLPRKITDPDESVALQSLLRWKNENVMILMDVIQSSWFIGTHGSFAETQYAHQL